MSKEILNDYIGKDFKLEQLEDYWISVYKIFDIPFICYYSKSLILVDDETIHEAKNNALTDLLMPSNELMRKFRVLNSSDLEHNNIIKLYYNIILECDFLKIDSHLNTLTKKINEIKDNYYNFKGVCDFFLKGKIPKTQKNLSGFFYLSKEHIISQLDFFNKYVLFLKNLKNILISKPEILI